MFKFGSTAKYVIVDHSNGAATEKLIKVAFLYGGNRNLNLNLNLNLNIGLDLCRLQLIVPVDLEA